jgi:F-type H+-transporting ATPase subunit b
MPQLDPSTFASQIFWLLVAFGVLFYLLRAKALPRVAEILETRQDRMAHDLDRAATLRQEAEEALASYEKLIAEAQERARERLRALDAQLAEEAAERSAAAEKEIAGRLQEAESAIEEAREAALKELRAVAIESSQAAVERLIGVKVTKKAAEAALRAAVREAA